MRGVCDIINDLMAGLIGTAVHRGLYTLLCEAGHSAR
jgi:hypothetical protein